MKIILLKKKILKSKTLKSIGSIFSAKILTYLIKIIAGIIVARQIGAEGKGIVTAALVIPEVFAAFGHIGLPVSNIYFLGKGRSKKTLLTNSLIFLVFACIFYTLISFALYPFYKEKFYNSINPIVVYSTFSITFLLITKHFLMHFQRGLENYKAYNIATLIQPMVRLIFILTVILVYTELTVNFVIFASIISIFIADLYNYYNISKTVSVSLKNKDKKQFKESISYGLKEYIGHVFMILNTKIDSLILVLLSIKHESLGIYNVAIGIAALIMFIPSSINVVLLPKITKSKSKNNALTILKKSIVLNLSFLIPATLFFFVFGKFLVPFVYGEEFKASYPLANILIIGTLLMSVSQLINKYFSGMGRPEIKSIIRGISLPIKFISLFVLFKYYGTLGAAWSFTFTNFILLLLSLIAMKKINIKK